MSKQDTVEIAWPPRFVQIRKIAPVCTPARPCGDPHTYRYGVLNSNESFPADYSITGWLLRAPSVGEPVHVLRVSRNATVMPGIFVTTEIVRIPLVGEFHTQNSIYYWSEIAETPQTVESLPVPMSGHK